MYPVYNNVIQSKRISFGIISAIRLIGLVSRVIPKTLKMVLETSLLNIQQYKVRIKGKVEMPVV